MYRYFHLLRVPGKSMDAKPSQRLDVVAVGSWSNFDHLFRVGRLPAPGDTVQITSSIQSVEKVYWGGCAPNNAAAAAKLGATAGLVSVVGRDFRERGYQTYFEELEIDLRGTITLEKELSGHSFLFSDADGDAICISHIGAAARQSEFEPDREVLSAAKVVTINYIFDRFTLRAAQIASEAGGRVVTSGALMTAPDFAKAMVETTHILVCTEHELNQLCDFLGLSSRTMLFDRGVRALVSTAGKRGCVVMTADGQVHIRTASAGRVIDPVGAGDGFVGGLATGLAFGYPLQDAVRLGAVVASFVVEEWGCQTNLPSFEQAAQRMLTSYGISL
jgi:sugar/nucleoside kinase (ribokinase family)